MEDLENAFKTLNFDPVLVKYLEDDFKTMAIELNSMILDQKVSTIVFDPKPDTDVFSNSETITELIDYILQYDRGCIMLYNIIVSNFPDNVDRHIMSKIKKMINFYILSLKESLT